MSFEDLKQHEIDTLANISKQLTGVVETLQKEPTTPFTDMVIVSNIISLAITISGISDKKMKAIGEDIVNITSPKANVQKLRVKWAEALKQSKALDASLDNSKKSSEKLTKLMMEIAEEIFSQPIFVIQSSQNKPEDKKPESGILYID